MAVLGLRGTDYRLLMDKYLHLSLLEGRIFLSNGKGSLLVKGGQHALVKGFNHSPKLTRQSINPDSHRWRSPKHRNGGLQGTHKPHHQDPNLHPQHQGGKDSSPPPPNQPQPKVQKMEMVLKGRIPPPPPPTTPTTPTPPPPPPPPPPTSPGGGGPGGGPGGGGGGP